MKDFEIQTNFAFEKGKRDTDRLVSKILLAFLRKLEGQHIEVNGKQCTIRRVGRGDINDKLMVDILNPTDEYDHIEFTIEKTGWGRSLTKKDG